MRGVGVDVLVVSLGATAGLRRADDELAASLGRAGASVELARARRPRELPTMALGDFAYARAARAAAGAGIARHDPRAILYSTTTAALLWPRPGAIRFDAPAAANRPGRHGLWQRPVERRRLREAPLLLPWSEPGLEETPSPRADALVVPVPVEPSGRGDGTRDIAAIAYGAHPEKKGLDRVLAAWRQARREGETLVVAGVAGSAGGEVASGGELAAGGVRYTGLIAPAEYRALLRRARVFVTAPRREDYGLAQLEALADGCLLVTTAAPGPYAALPLARALDRRLVAEPGGLGGALRAALDDPPAGYAARALAALAPFRPANVDALVAERLLPLLLG
jgi:glycosyltransferase involved in cell wall biosynthesis